MIRSSCLCGQVRWQVNGPLRSMSHCHCSMCRKAHGAAFATYAAADARDLEYTAGEALRRAYVSSPGIERGFCSVCGSSLPDVFGDEAYLPAGCMDDDPGIRPSRHIFYASRVPWLRMDDGLPRHDAYEPGRSLAPVERRADVPAADGVLHGSCLCGAVAFEVTPPFERIRNCHCSRCRKARAAAHTTNAFTRVDAVRFTRGADQVQVFRLPGAKRFGHAFCITCGSGMPRLDPERGVAVVALATLDDDPGAGPEDHIYVGSMAPWYTIHDELPRHAERP